MQCLCALIHLETVPLVAFISCAICSHVMPVSSTMRSPGDLFDNGVPTATSPRYRGRPGVDSIRAESSKR